MLEFEELNYNFHFQLDCNFLCEEKQRNFTANSHWIIHKYAFPQDYLIQKPFFH